MFVRLAMPADEEAIVELVRQDIAETLPHLTFQEDVTRETFRQTLTGDPTLFVVERNREIVGFLYALLNGYAFTDGLYVVQEVLYVRSDMRGSRAAALLVKAFVEWGERLDAKEIIFGIANKHQPERTARFFELVADAEIVGFYLKRLGAEDERRRQRRQRRG